MSEERLRVHAQRQQLLVKKGAILAAVLVAVFLLSVFGPQPFGALGPLWEDSERFYWTREKIQRVFVSLGPYSSAVFILVQAFQVLVSPIPGELTGMVGGYVYGNGFGFVFSTFGLTLGSWLAFELAAIFGRPFVEAFVRRGVLDKFNFVTTKIGATICFFLYLFPGFPKDYLCYVLGLSRIRLSTFLIVSTFGRMPGTYFLTLQGATLRSEKYLTAFIFVAASTAILFLGYLYREDLLRWIKGRRKDER